MKYVVKHKNNYVHFDGNKSVKRKIPASLTDLRVRDPVILGAAAWMHPQRSHAPRDPRRSRIAQASER
jgi:hypothetical protein